MATIRHSRKSEQEQVVLSLFGNGKISIDEALNHIFDFIDSQPEDVSVRIVVPAIEETVPNLSSLGEALLDEGLEVHALILEGVYLPRGWKAIIRDAVVMPTINMDDLISTLIDEVDYGLEGSSLVALWDDDDEFLGKVCRAALPLPVRDLTAAFELIEFDSEDTEEPLTNKDTEKENKLSEDYTDEPYTEESLEAFSDEELLDIAKEDLGLKVRSDAKRETLIKRILKAEADLEKAADDSEDVEDSGEDEVRTSSPAKASAKGKEVEDSGEDDDDSMEGLEEAVEDSGEDDDDSMEGLEEAVEDIVYGALEELVKPDLENLNKNIVEVISTLSELLGDIHESLLSIEKNTSTTVGADTRSVEKVSSDEDGDKEAPTRRRRRR